MPILNPALISAPINSALIARSENATHKHELVRGWVGSPNGRGTMSIIWSCVFTIWLCTWTVLCLNVPAPTDGRWRRLRRKLLWMTIAIFGPEFVLCAAIGQWVSARRSVVEFVESGYEGWSVSHAFFADMGGYMLQTPDWVPFPLDAKQLHYLVARKYIHFPTTERKEIEDKNKLAEFARLVTVLQTLWFTAQCIGRVAQSLAITTFELGTLAIVACTLGTFFCWAGKPLDVSSSIVLKTDIPLANILLDAGHATKQPYDNTPLDFVSHNKWSWAVYWSWGVRQMSKIHIRTGSQRRPIDRIANDKFPALTPGGMLFLFFFEVVYAGIHMAGWNIHFPSKPEHILWRISATILMASILAYWIIDRYTFGPGATQLSLLGKRLRGIFTMSHAPGASPLRIVKQTLSVPAALLASHSKPALPPSSSSSSPDLSTAVALSTITSASTDDHGARNHSRVPLRALLPGILFASSYALARAYLVVEVWIGLRALPPSAYDTVTWSNYIPHF